MRGETSSCTYKQVKYRSPGFNSSQSTGLCSCAADGQRIKDFWTNNGSIVWEIKQTHWTGQIIWGTTRDFSMWWPEQTKMTPHTSSLALILCHTCGQGLVKRETRIRSLTWLDHLKTDCWLLHKPPSLRNPNTHLVLLFLSEGKREDLKKENRFFFIRGKLIILQGHMTQFTKSFIVWHCEG